MLRQLKQDAFPYLLLLPLIALLLCLAVGLAEGVVTSFGYMPTFGKDSFTLKNYLEVLGSDAVLLMIARSFVVALVASLLSTGLAILLSWCLVTVFKGRGAFVHLSRLPMLIPYSACALLTVLMLSDSGFLTRIVAGMGFTDAAQALGSTIYHANCIGIVVALVFHQVSYVTYMILIDMAHISSTLGEAAANLGASQWRCLKDVLLPHCMQGIRNTFIFIFAISFGQYEVPYLLGATTAKLASVQAYIDYTNFDFVNSRPEAMALNAILLIITLIVSFACFHANTREARKWEGGKDGTARKTL